MAVLVVVLFITYHNKGVVNGVGGGLIELVYLPDNKLMVVNEEGLLRNYPFNEAASLLAMGVIVGDVVIADSSEID